MSSDTPAVPRNRSVELQEVESSSSNENLSSMQNAHASTDALQALVTTCGEGEAVGDQKDFVARWWVDVLFVCCGVSVFARTEAFFMQTDLFAECFDLGVNFYPIACGLAFVPGVLVTMLQNAYDIRIDRKYGTRKAHLIRLVGAASISVALIVGYFGVVTANPSLRKSMFLIGPILVLIGVAASITWGSVTQITSCLPGKFQTYCFIGSMCPFLLYLPTNVLLGDLCVLANASHNVTMSTAAVPVEAVSAESFGPSIGEIATAGGGSTHINAGGVAAPLLRQYPYGNSTPSPGTGTGTMVARWNQVETFFAMCCVLTVLGCAAIVAAMFTNAVGRRLKKRDVSLHQATVKSENIYEDSIPGEGAPLLRGAVNGGGGGDEAAEDSAHEQALSQMALAKLIWMPALSQFLVTVGSQLVVSQYVSVPKQFYKSQTTMLLYAYYIGSCLGMVCALSKRTWIGPKTLLIASIVRFAIFPLTLLYITHPNALGPKGSKHADIVVQVINFIFCFTNGHLFSMTYSQANAQFKSPAGASRASSTLSVAYYLAISFAIGASILLNTALCSDEPGGCPTKKNATLLSIEGTEEIEVWHPSSPYLWDRSLGHFEF